MDKNYIITSNGSFVSEDELAHWGILGMRWGRRRYQNSDGSLTAEGRERYGVSEGRDTRGDGNSGSGKSSTRNSRGTGNSGHSERLNKKEAAKAKKQDEKEKKAEERKTEEKKAEEKKPDDTTNERKTKLDGKSLDDISDKNLKDRLERMRNEDAYDKMMVERGYVQVEKYSDMDRKISELKKQKEYADLVVGLDTQTQISELSRQKELKQLQKDVKQLDKELNAKEKSAVQKLAGKVTDEVLVPSAISAGKTVLTGWLTKKGMELAGLKGDVSKDAVSTTADKVGSKLKDKTDKVVELTKEEMAKADAKAAAENTKRSAEEYAKTESNYNSANYRSKNGERTQVDPNESRALAVYDSSYAKRTGEKTRVIPDSSGTSKAKNAEDSSRDYYEKHKDFYERRSKGQESTVLNEDDYKFTPNKSKTSAGSDSSSRSNVIDVEYEVVSDNKTSSSAQSTVALGERKVAGYLSAPASSSSSSISLGKKTVSGYLGAPASSSSSKKFSASITKNATSTRIKSLKNSGNYTNAEIANKLGISEGTLNYYLYGGGN